MGVFMTPINSAAGNYGRVASASTPPVDRPPAAQAVQSAPQPAQRPSAVVTISPEARERADAAERAARAQAQQATDASPRAQAATQAAQNQFAQSAAAQNAGGGEGASP
jgi:hypothetical protein